MQLKDVMQSPVVTIAAETPLAQALAIMHAYGISHLPVLQGQTLSGLLTRPVRGSVPQTLRANGLSLAQIGHGQCPRVLDVMQRGVKTLPQEVPAHETARLIWEQGLPCIVVVRDGKPCGIVSPEDLLDIFIATIDREQKRKYKRLLVPTHFSTTANYAVRRGLELTRQHDAKLRLLHVRKRLNSKRRTGYCHCQSRHPTPSRADCHGP